MRKYVLINNIVTYLYYNIINYILVRTYILYYHVIVYGYICTKYNRVLITGGRANDLPGVGYTLVRGVYDFSGLPTKRRRRSVYGTSRPDGFTKYVKKSLRSHL